ncbi:esterase/lipase family protein [Tundrisphaera lichenicola]|uniref:esterase/lipase family protein n=1 Tax=Tundrisphaera lichenicola TaxID=2029860 RepID=UPI003EBF35AC
MALMTHLVIPRRLLACTLLIALIGSNGGCGGVQTRDAVLRRSLRESIERVETALSLSAPSREVLARHRLLGRDSEAAATCLELKLQGLPGAEPNGALALAELWYREAVGCHRNDPSAAMVAFRNAASASALAVGEPRTGCVERAVEIHNRATAHLIRLSEDPRIRGDLRWADALSGFGINAAASSAFVDPSRFATIDPADDLLVRGMRHEYVGKGLGVPVVALRPNDRTNPTESNEAYYPLRLRVGATVVAEPGGSLLDGSWRTAPLTLVFHDPFLARSVTAGQQTLPMAYDRTTPLAVQASQKIISASTLAGLFVSDLQTGIDPGLYLLRPYEPGKIPVVLIHGLSSNPAAFVQTINDLRNDPRISGRYQFLLFAYKTGQPIPTSAYRLRRALYDLESRFGGDPAFHQMVLVGHSMGGNLTRFMVSDSGTTLWNAVLNRTPEQFQASPETRAELTELLIFRPVPFVRRAIFIAAPHRGSRIADAPFGRIVSRFIRPPQRQVELVEELKAANGPDIFKDDLFRRKSINSIGNLSPRSPILLAIDRLPIAPGVRTDSIIFDFLGRFPSDLVVRRSSSTLSGVESERTLPGTHFSQQSQPAIEELRRLLLDEVRTEWTPGPIPSAGSQE